MLFRSSLGVLNSLPQASQLSMMEELSALSEEILGERASSIGKFHRKGKVFYRLRLHDLRLYLEKVDLALHCHYMLPKNSLNDFLFRCKLPSSEEAIIEDYNSFWEYLESLSRGK